MLTLFIDMTLMRALLRIEKGRSATSVEIDEQMSTIVANGEWHLIVLESLDILVAGRHGFRRVTVSTHS